MGASVQTALSKIRFANSCDRWSGAFNHPVDHAQLCLCRRQIARFARFK